ncbi:MAG: MotA/TolQ/ExbB proton channel family protein [Phycisphaerae bacterium]|nr:MotA/TolQ/ExbB proton channel family protein [Phycisphaerae bacterium]
MMPSTLRRLLSAPCSTFVGAAFALFALDRTAFGEGGRSFGEVFFVSRDLAVDGESRIDWIGSGMIWLLILMSVASVSMIVLAWSRNRPGHMLARAHADEARRLVSEGKFAEALDRSRSNPSDFARILHAALTAAPGGYDAMARSGEQMADELVVRRFRRIEPLNVLGQVAPMLGLFGTVYGMIVAFMTISAMGGTADPVALASGIGTALVTTFWGLIIAIPALSAYAVVRNTIDASSAEAAREVELILARFRPSANLTPVAAMTAGTAS